MSSRRSFDPVVELLEDAADDAQIPAAALGLKQNDEATLRGILEELVGKPAGPGNVPPAVPGLKDKCNVAKAAETVARTRMSLEVAAKPGAGRVDCPVRDGHCGAGAPPASPSPRGTRAAPRRQARRLPYNSERPPPGCDLRLGRYTADRRTRSSTG